MPDTGARPPALLPLTGRCRAGAGLPTNTLFDAQQDDPKLGWRFLVTEAGDACEPKTERTARRICSNNGWWHAFSKRKRGKTIEWVRRWTIWQVGFATYAPNQLRLIDITEHRTSEADSTSARSRMCSPAKSLAIATTPERNPSWPPGRLTMWRYVAARPPSTSFTAIAAAKPAFCVERTTTVADPAARYTPVSRLAHSMSSPPCKQQQPLPCLSSARTTSHLS
ncbi:transposase subunit [Mycobacteroides abscessus]|nr:transposase subunit [Mycobacteroides abscessus]